MFSFARKMMLVPKILEVQALDDYILRIKFEDGVVGEVDLSYLAGRGVFTFWNQYENFRNVSVINGRWLAWSDEIDMDADSLYLKLTNKKPEDLFPLLKENPTYA
jgi:hypothetical protein